MKKKLPHQLTAEELLELANSTKFSEEANNDGDNILDFLSFYKIGPGTNLVPTATLYKLYKSWSGCKDYGPVHFSTALQNYFVSEAGSKRAAVYIDISAINLTKKAKDAFFKTKPDRFTRKYKNKNYKKLMDEFIEVFSVKAGKFKIESRVIYAIFLDWAEKNKKRTLQQVDFTFFLKLYEIPYTKVPKVNETIFLIDKDEFVKKVDGVTLEKAKDHPKIKRPRLKKDSFKETWYKKEAYQKIKRKISSPQT